MKDPLHDKWYLQKTKARSEVLGVLANSLKREFPLTAKHQSFLLFIIYTGSSPEKSPPQVRTSLCWLLCKQTNVDSGTTPGHSVWEGEGMVTVRLTDQRGYSLSITAHMVLVPAYPWVLGVKLLANVRRRATLELEFQYDKFFALCCDDDSIIYTEAKQ